MNIFIAGGTGAIGRVLLPMLVSAGHRVTAMTRSPERAAALTAAGARPVVGDVYDATALTRLVEDARPDVVIHQLTAFGTTTGNPLEETIRVRVEGTRNLVAAARSAGARRFIAQSISFVCSPGGPGLTDETTPLHVEAPASMRPLVDAVASLEQQTLQSGMSAVVLRYGWFYGRGTNYDPAGIIPNGLRSGRMAIAGQGRGVYSLISVDDAALATVAALDRGHGIYNIVDDDPAPLSEWLATVAGMLGAPPPARADIETARAKLGDMMVFFMDEQRGASNAKAKRDLDWRPATPSWRDGLARLYQAS